MTTGMSLQGKSVLLAGATGLVGHECLELLLADPVFAHITAIVRHLLLSDPTSTRLNVQTVDFERLGERPDLFAVDQIVCALGTTIRKAGSQSAFRRVDFDYPLRIAKLGLDNGARHFLLVSSMGANPQSRVFYTRVKGELEDAIEGLGYRAFTIVRPSVLIGKRTERRLGEEIARRLAFLTPPRMRPVHAHQVAAALVHAAQQDEPGQKVIDNRMLQSFPV